MYDVIYTDPAWQFKVRNERTGSGRSASRHYRISTLDHMKSLPVRALANRDCALFMWATMPNLPQAFELGESWGFRYSTVAFVWVKLNRRWVARLPISSLDNLEAATFMGMGYTTRSNAELCLLFTVGSPRRVARNVRQIIYAPNTHHSAKPDAAYQRIETLFSANRRIELFARHCRPGWVALGNEIDGLDLAHSIPIHLKEAQNAQPTESF